MILNGVNRNIKKNGQKDTLHKWVEKLPKMQHVNGKRKKVFLNKATDC